MDMTKVAMSKQSHHTNRINIATEEVRRKYAMMGVENGLYVGWTLPMTRRSARRIAVRVARSAKKLERALMKGAR